MLLQTPRQGYATALSCDSCRTPARCPACTGPLQLTAAHRPPGCRWCGTEQHGWVCAECGGHGLRAPVLGEQRTAEEIGRAFPLVPVRTSAGDRVLATVDPVPAVVVATPGAEPVVEGGYTCVVLLDTWLMLARTDLRTEEEALRRWLAAAALARPADEGGRVVAVGEPSLPALQALLRWDPAGFARRELEERQSAHLPPASRLATLTAPDDDLTAALAQLVLPPGAEVLGPVPVPAAPARSPTSRCCCGGGPGAAHRGRRAVAHPRGDAGRPVGAQAAAGARAGGPRRARVTRRVRRLDRRPPPFPHRPRSRPVPVQPIRLFGDPVLRTPAVPVTDFDKELRRLVADLTDTMLEAPGAGLAAPQIGVGLRVFTWYVDDELGHLVNPVLDLSEEEQFGPEGCLSLPDLTFDCARALRVVAKGFDMHGEPVTIEGHDLLARAIQHETDHLDGVLFLDRLDRETRRAAMKAVRESGVVRADPTAAPTFKVSPHPTRGLGL